MSNVRTTQVPGEPAQYNGWTGAELLALVGWLEAEIERLKFLNGEERQTIDDLSRLCLRAANALSGGATWSQRDELITQLRKAAE